MSWLIRIHIIFADPDVNDVLTDHLNYKMLC